MGFPTGPLYSGLVILSDSLAVSSGCVTVGAPVAKRLALASLSLRTAALPGVTPNLASRLAGNWTSVLMYRRCLCAVVDGLFALGTRALDFSPDTVMPLSRSTCRELVLLSVLAPVMCSNVAVNYHACMHSDVIYIYYMMHDSRRHDNTI